MPGLVIGAGRRAARCGDACFDHRLRDSFVGELPHRMPALDVVKKRRRARCHLVVGAGDEIAKVGKRREILFTHSGWLSNKGPGSAIAL